MNHSSNLSWAERLESLKAGILAALSLGFAFSLFTFSNSLLLAKRFAPFASLEIPTLDTNLAIRGAIALFSGFLFGVTYRYVVRQDTNSHLKEGAVLAFGLVRGLAQVDVGLSSRIEFLSLQNLWLLATIGFESILMFAIAAFSLDFALQRRWILPFNSN